MSRQPMAIGPYSVSGGACDRELPGVLGGDSDPDDDEPDANTGPTVVIQHDTVNTVKYDISGDGSGSGLTITFVNASFFDLDIELAPPEGGQRVVKTPANSTHRVMFGQAGVVRIHAYGADTPVGAVNGPVREITVG